MNRTLKRWAVPGAVAAVVALLLGVYVVGGSPGSADSPADTAAAQEIAEANAGGAVVKYTGPNHTVYHSTDPLPSANAPAADGRPTLVWFSGVSCHVCEEMEPFAHQAAAQLRDQVRFVEKEVSRDRSASSKYAVRGTPTFVLIDSTGREISRFFYQPSAEQFTKAIQNALQRAA